MIKLPLNSELVAITELISGNCRIPSPEMGFYKNLGVTLLQWVFLPETPWKIMT